MSQSDISYLEQRAAEQRALANSASHVKVIAVHLELARIYADRAAQDELASKLKVEQARIPA